MDVWIANTIINLHALTFCMAQSIFSEYFNKLSNLILHNDNLTISKKDHKGLWMHQKFKGKTCAFCSSKEVSGSLYIKLCLFLSVESKNEFTECVCEQAHITLYNRKTYGKIELCIK